MCDTESGTKPLARKESVGIFGAGDVCDWNVNIEKASK